MKVEKKSFRYCFVLFLFTRGVRGFINTSELSDDDAEHSIKNPIYCVCVPYWQCKEDYSGLIEDADPIDVRNRRRESDMTDIDSSTKCQGDLDVCCQVQCGLRRTTDGDVSLKKNDIFGYRILGENNEAQFGEFPWMLGILQGKIYRCGASLIHPQVALTAAHCVTGTGPFIIRAGEWNWESVDEPLPYQNRIAQKILIHPQYHSRSLRNDVALIILDKPYRLTENVMPTCLPYQGTRFDLNRCIAMGWGKNSYKKGSYQSILKKMDLPIVPPGKCLEALQKARLGPFFHLHGSFLCAGGEENKDTCKGDGGSPLVCPIKGHPARYQQVGIVSWGLSCGLQNTPGVYANIPLFMDWIDFTLGVNGFEINIYKY